jgi:catechol 2,3-dioxygenase-like lactoylglutathione lyase family enzyme
MAVKPVPGKGAAEWMGGSRMALTKVLVISVPVSDQERAKDFYVDKLGFDLIREDDSVPGIRWVQVAPKGGNTALTLVDWFETMPAGSLRGLVIGSHDLQADYERFRAAGVVFDSPPQRESYATEAVCHDPDGNMIVLQQM